MNVFRPFSRGEVGAEAIRNSLYVFNICISNVCVRFIYTAFIFFMGY